MRVVMRATLNGRLLRLEQLAARPIEERETLEERRAREAAEWHAAVWEGVNVVGADLPEGIVERLQGADPADLGAGALWAELQRMAIALHQERHAGPRQLHPDVAIALLENPEALMLHDCALCGMNIPVICGGTRFEGGKLVNLPGVRLFDACPGCGGRVGWYAYWHRQREAEAMGGAN